MVFKKPQAETNLPFLKSPHEEKKTHKIDKENRQRNRKSSGIKLAL